MKPRLIRDLLEIASEANRWPRLKHLRDEALRELEAAHLSTVETILPVMVVPFTDGKDGVETEPRAASAIPRGTQ
jgi:hypothetical protein